MEFRFRQKEKMINASIEGTDALPDWGDVLRRQRNLRATISIGSSPSVAWESRFESVGVSYPSRGMMERGTLVFQDFTFSPIARVSLRLRGIAYETDSYDSRIYEFEEDLPGTYLDPALSGKGFRWYVIGRYEHGRLFGVSVKYSQSRSDGRKRTGEKSVDVTGDLENRWALQIDVKL